MILTDSHCHLDMLDVAPYEYSFLSLLQETRKQHVQYILCVGVNLHNFPQMLNLIKSHKHVYASVGLHPNENYYDQFTAEKLLRFAKHKEVVALGETGLDYYRNQISRE